MMRLGEGPVMGMGPVPEGINAALVQRKDRSGLFGVVVRHGRFVVPLPEGYDGQTSVVTESGWVLVTHPTLPPLIADPYAGIARPMDASLLPKNLVRKLIAPGVE